jgi:hypothetical protein
MNMFKLNSFRLLTTWLFMNAAYSLEIIDRNAEGDWVLKEITRDQLSIDAEKNTPLNFAFYRGISNQELLLDQLKEDDLRRQYSLLYSLERARRYFNELSPEYLKTIGRIPVRVQMNREFDPARLFGDHDVIFNDATVVRASGRSRLASKGIPPWPMQIWFREQKVIKFKWEQAFVTQDSIQHATTQFADSLLSAGVVDYAVERELTSVSRAKMNHQLALWLFAKIGTPLVLQAFFQNREIDFSLDTQMIPEIVAHEFAHLAMSDYVSLFTKNMPVAEGLAHYFAARITGQKVLASNLGEYGHNNRPIKVNRFLRYRTADEYKEGAFALFVFGFLMQLKEKLEKAGINEREIDRVVFEARRYINFSSDDTIKQELPQGLLQASQKCLSQKESLKFRRSLLTLSRQLGL